jgi:DNA polymerase
MNVPHLSMDYETFSTQNLKAVGAYRYANDPSTVVLCCAFALGDEEPYVWTPGTMLPDKYHEALLDPTVLIYAFAPTFEIAISLALMRKTFHVEPPALSRFRCVQSLARRAALPAKLEKLAEVLNLSHQKDNRGKALIRKFSVMQSPRKPTKAHPNGQPARRIRPEDEPELFAEFCRYCAQDVRAEREAAHKLAYFDEPINNSNFTLDAVINARGVPVNLSALRHAWTLVQEETEIVSAKFRELTGFEVTQNGKLLAWLHRCGVDLPDLQAETIENFLQSV